MSDKKLYEDRECDELEPFYTDHICAMTGEQLHAKSAIAAELAYRDKENQSLRDEIELLKSDNLILSVGLLDAHVVVNGMGIVGQGSSIGDKAKKAAERICGTAEKCKAEIEAAAVERAVDDLQYEPLPFEDSPGEDYCLASELKEWAAARRKEAQG